MFKLGNEVENMMVVNEFNELLLKYVRSCHEEGSTWGIYEESDVEVSRRVEDDFKTILERLREYRLGLYRTQGIYNCDSMSMQYVLYDYLLSAGVCYVEIPKWKTENGIPKRTFDKGFYTKNPFIIASWLGVPVQEVVNRYTCKTQTLGSDSKDGVLRSIRLNTKAGNNTVTLPRRHITMDTGLRIKPLAMMKEDITHYKGLLSTGIYHFEYYKDNGTTRSLDSTISDSIIGEYYNDPEFVENVFACMETSVMDVCGTVMPSTVGRGYIRVPELGASRYDSNYGVRSLNIARVKSYHRVESVDRTFIDVNLSDVVDKFLSAVQVMGEELPLVYMDYMAKNDYPDSSAVIIKEIMETVQMAYLLRSTEYTRELHLYMVSHQQWFDKYMGTPIATINTSTNFGIGEFEF